MGIVIYLLIGYVAIIGLGVLVLFWGKQDGDSVFDRLYRLFGTHLPYAVKGAARLCCGTKGPEYVDRTWNYIVWSNNPIVQIFYLLIIVAGYTVFAVQGYPHIPNAYLHWIHKYIGFLIFCWCIYNFAMSSMKDPGLITEKNVKRLMEVFPPDDQIFFKETECTTCKFYKPARSKHCGLCNWCVAKFDHHCIWVNNCVGLTNHYYFLNFLLSNCIICLYGFYLGGTILWEYVNRLKLFEAVFIDPRTQERLKASYYVVIQYLMHTHGYIVFVVVLSLVMGVVLIGFWGWHMYLVLAGTTSNEVAKWNALKRFLKEKYRQETKIYKSLQEAYDLQQAAIFEQKPLGADEEVLEKPVPPEDFISSIKNGYTKGWWGNLRMVIWPPDIHSDAWINAGAQSVELENCPPDGAVKKRKSGKKEGKKSQ